MKPRAEWLGVAFFVLYVARLCPTLSLNGDSAELVTAAALWGVPHAPGYPLFTAIGHAFTWIPIGTLAWRVHLTSAVMHAGAVAATAAAAEAITRSRAAAVAAGCVLGLAQAFFVGSLYAEVFPLNDLFFALLLLGAVRRVPSPALAALAGLASAHHMMIALAAPALVVLAWKPLVREVTADARRALTLLAPFAVPFVASYALVPLAASRDPALSWGDVHDVGSFVALVTRQDYGGLFSAVHGGGHGSGPERLAALGGLLVGSFGWVTLAVALVGAVDLVRRDRTIGAGVILAALTTGPLFAWANALDTGSEVTLAYFARFTTMAHVPIALAAGAGVAAIAARLGDRTHARSAGLVLLTAWLAVCFWRVRGVTLRDDTRGEAFAHDLVLRSPDGALLLLSGDAPTNAALYVCAVEQRCGARVALSPGGLFLPWAMAQTRRRHPEIDIPWTSGPALKHTHELALAEVTKRPVFAYPDLLVKDPQLEASFDAVPDGLLFRLWPKGTEPDREKEAFDASARTMATGAECEGCRPAGEPSFHPSQSAQIVGAYEAAATNHARAAARFQ